MNVPTVIICRHGNTFDRGEVVTRVGGRTDLPLSRSGMQQANALAAHFATTSFDRAYTSDLKRTRRTLDTLLNGRIEAQTRTFLREVDYGPDENKPEAEVVARLGEAALLAWDTDAVLPRDWILDVDGIQNAWAEFMEQQVADGGTAIVMTSNGVARFIFSALALDAGLHDIKLRTGAFGVLRYIGGLWTLESWNRRPIDLPE